MSQFLKMVGEHKRAGRAPFTAKATLRLIAVLFLLGGVVYWYQIVQLMTDQVFAQFALTAILAIAPPALTSFLFPFTPTGMLLQKIQSKTVGYVVIIVSAIILIYYQWIISLAWWETQPVVADSHWGTLQTLIGLIGFVAIPALAWPPLNDSELVESIRQARLIKRYELQTQADLAILRKALVRAGEHAQVGFANLGDKEKHELNAIMRGLTKGIDTTIAEIVESVETVSGANLKNRAIHKAPIGQYLDYVSEALGVEPEPASVPPATAKTTSRTSNNQSVMANAKNRYGGSSQTSMVAQDDEDDDPEPPSYSRSYSNR